MDTRRCLRIADRIDALLLVELGRGIDLQRMLAEPLYARDVLLVCQAHKGHELAALAGDFRTALDAPEDEAAPPSGWGGGHSGFDSSSSDGFRPSEPASLPGGPTEGGDPGAKPGRELPIAPTAPTARVIPLDPVLQMARAAQMARSAQADRQRRARDWLSPLRWRR